MITLAVLAGAIVLLGVLSGYLDTARKAGDRAGAIVQATVFYGDIKSYIEKKSPKQRENIYATLYQSAIPFVGEKEDFTFMLSCRPMDNGFNLNWLTLPDNAATQRYKSALATLFDKIAERYQIDDMGMLVEMIETYIERNRSRAKSSGAKPYQQKNGMISFREFERIVETYIEKTDDRSVERVPWEALFVFAPPTEKLSRNHVDGDYMSPALVSVWFDLDPEEVAGTWSPGKGALEAFAKRQFVDYDKKLFRTKFPKRSVCRAQYIYKSTPYGFRFVDQNGEVKYFEFLGKIN